MIYSVQRDILMKINQVKQFVANNVSRFEKGDVCANKGKNHSFNLYDKNNAYCGEYKFLIQSSSDYLGVKSSMSVTRIMNSKLGQALQEIVCLNKNYVTLKDKTSDTFTKALPSEITTTTTVLDFINDKFLTVRSVSKLKNKLKRLGKDDPDFKYSDDFVIYEPLKGKPKYEKSVEFVREGTISEATENNSTVNKRYTPQGSIRQFPYIFW